MEMLHFCFLIYFLFFYRWHLGLIYLFYLMEIRFDRLFYFCCRDWDCSFQVSQSRVYSSPLQQPFCAYFWYFWNLIALTVIISFVLNFIFCFPQLPPFFLRSAHSLFVGVTRKSSKLERIFLWSREPNNRQRWVWFQSLSPRFLAS